MYANTDDHNWAFWESHRLTDNAECSNRKNYKNKMNGLFRCNYIARPHEKWSGRSGGWDCKLCCTLNDDANSFAVLQPQRFRMRAVAKQQEKNETDGRTQIESSELTAGIYSISGVCIINCWYNYCVHSEHTIKAVYSCASLTLADTRAHACNDARAISGRFCYCIWAAKLPACLRVSRTQTAQTNEHHITDGLMVTYTETHTTADNGLD